MVAYLWRHTKTKLLNQKPFADLLSGYRASSWSALRDVLFVERAEDGGTDRRALRYYGLPAQCFVGLWRNCWPCEIAVLHSERITMNVIFSRQTNFLGATAT